MTCPYCGKKMQRGEICAGYSCVVWRPERRLLSPGLTISPMWFDRTAENAYCMHCGVLLVRPSGKAAAKFEEKYRKRLAKRDKP